ncbi:hypothetical protein H3T86_04755 [Bifidobacterium sp. W8113]|uniref:Cell surface protein n=1 Tax=Bifidobacterium choladohabitans TaxID=2750947 RepID=A0ABS0R222_9BIFI|nr:hypothetical protein [Bifidobacterium choladohabitans]MBI0090019.1 hypothetical protein [Bifidobacterium choladohabitans]MBI0144729.1 hypothetical protein [Bifidobacterium choladohabitans]
MKRLQERGAKGSQGVNRPIIAVLVTLLATLAMVVPLGLSALSAGQANAIDGQDETASRKPLLYRMLGYNNKIDSYQDELRMDFILRVKHNEFDPSCADATSGADTKGNCNLAFVYQYKGSDDTSFYRRIKYLNTIASASSSDQPWSGAYKWAQNQDEYFTVHTIINSGLYDYLTISIEGDLALKNSADASYYQPGGANEPVNIYAVVGKQDDALSCLRPSNSWSWSSGIDNCRNFDPDTMINAPDRVSNITSTLAANDKNFTLYMQECLGTGADLQCSGPYSWVGWNSNPNLYGGNQANWGMVTDYGFPDYKSNATGPIAGTDPGTAPARSFFVYWLNVRGSTKANPDGICSETNSYYYQWVALKDSEWVPVNELTPEPVLVTGQQPSPNTATTTTSKAAQVSKYSAFNLPKQPDNPNEMFATDKNGQPMPAQKADGGIDFKEAKEKQDLDGYFKMVTWPVTTNRDGSACTVSPEVYNPDQKGLVGIRDGMNSSDIERNISAGWTINSAFYKYDVPRPDDPTITKIENDADAGLDASGSVYTSKLDPVVSGECTPSKDAARPNKVVLYGEDPANPIVEGQGTNGDDLVKGTDTWGFRLGEAECQVDPKSKQGGSWRIQDTNKLYPSPDSGNKYSGYRRYHAWVIESISGFGLTSYFSNIGTAYFVSSENVPDASKFSVTVPHTVNGSLPADSVVVFKGEVSPIYTAWSSGGLGMTDSRMVVSMKQNTASDWTSLLTTPANTFQRDAAAGTTSSVADSATGLTLGLTKTAASTWSWTLNIPADRFTGYDGSDETQLYDFRIEMVNPMNIRSDPASIERKVDMTPTALTLERYDVFQVAGKAYKYVDGDRKVPETKGTLVHVTWPGGSGTDVVVGDQGSWQAVPPEGINQGQFSAQVLSDDAESPDAQGRFQGGNQSASVSHELEFRPSNSALPLTGGWPLSVLKILLLIALGLAGFVACLRNRQESRH